MRKKINEGNEEYMMAKCGLFCEACSVYIATRKDHEKLKALSDWLQVTSDDLSCRGCNSEKVSVFCQDCAIVTCCQEKGVEDCADCHLMPCDKLKDFQMSGKPHRLGLVDSLWIKKALGAKEWKRRQIEHYSCRSCHTVNSAYDLRCRECGHSPANRYVEENKALITEHLRKVGRSNV